MKAKRITLCIIFWMLSTVGYTQFWNHMDAHIKISSSVKVIDNKLYMSGIDTLASLNDRLLSVYDGVSYDTSIGVSYGGPVYTFEKYDGYIYMAGDFYHIGNPVSLPSNGIHTLARWDGIQFDSIGAFPDPNYKVDVLKAYNNELYIGGKFQNGAGLGISNLMKYNGANFSDVGGGIVGNFTEVWSMVVYNGDLIVAGSFFSAGGIPVENVARWDGTQWHSMGNGIGPYIFCMTVDTISNILYAGGAVNYSGSTPIDHVAYWDGLNWQQVGSGFPLIPNVQTLCMYKGELYAGAGTPNQPLAERIKKWDGQTWHSLNSLPTDKGVYDLCEFQGSLFASGNFNEIDSACCYWGLAYYTDTTTVGLSSPLTHSENIFHVYPNPANETLFVDGINENEAVVTIFNMEGKLALSKTTTGNFQLDISALHDGIYRLNVQFKNGEISNHKFIKYKF